MTESTEDFVKSLFSQWKPWAKVKHIGALAPDASMRRYFRVLFEDEGQPFNTVLAMVFDSTACPEADAESAIPSDAAYIELTEYLYKNGIGHFQTKKSYFKKKRDQMISYASNFPESTFVHATFDVVHTFFLCT